MKTCACWIRTDDAGFIEEVITEDPAGKYHSAIKWHPLSEEADFGDVFFDGVLYRRPVYAVGFDFEKKEWNEDVTPYLDAAKAQKCAEITHRTNELIALNGFEFAGKRFTLGEATRLADIDFGLENAQKLKDAGVLGEEELEAFFPIECAIIAGETFLFNNPLELRMFFTALAEYHNDPNGPAAIGRALIKQVKDADTIEAVEAIVDTRHGAWAI